MYADRGRAPLTNMDSRTLREFQPTRPLATTLLY